MPKLKSSFFLVPTLLLSALFWAACDSGEAEFDPGLHQLAQDFRVANSAPTIQPMLALYELEGTDQRTVTMLKAALQYELGLEIAAIEFEPLSGAPEETIEFVHDGVHYGPSLEPEYRMRVRYAVDDGFTSLFTIGQNDAGDWRIVSAKPLPEPAL